MTDKPAIHNKPSDDLSPVAKLQGIVKEYQTPLLCYVKKLIGGSFDEAQDIVQEVFIRTYRKLQRDGADGIGNPRCWLYRVTHNLAMDAGRKRGRRRKMQEKVMQDPVLTSSIVSRADPVDAGLARSEARKLAMQAVQKLPDEQRSVILLKIMQGMTLKEISSVTGLKIGTVNYRLTQGLRDLSQRLKSTGAV